MTPQEFAAIIAAALPQPVDLSVILADIERAIWLAEEDDIETILLAMN
jgi:hypothetical protein